ncbi:hypothetical protein FG379_002372 [Cryptosporidium bovis]|uniref:uncharacterized protein n=1 Tax=Cryptosporidium bovis TaxID=310047 RepID=UPI00351A1A78|nr:hypothetical protein FG379_002372 [Cryptosporidium bovis]
MPLSQNMSMSELSRFRTRICERKALHGVCELDEKCPFSHCLSWHRRNPYEYAYRPNLCPNVVFQNENKKMRVKNYCQRGRMCMFSHTKEEQMYHVLVYKTQLCREYPLCTKHYCPFAHGLDELRDPEKIDFDPVQGPEVIERQRLIHDSNKFSDKTDNLEKRNGNEANLQDGKLNSDVLSDNHESASSLPGDSSSLSNKASKNSTNIGSNCSNDIRSSPRITGKSHLSPATSISTSIGSSPRKGTSRMNSSFAQRVSDNNGCSTAPIQNSRQLAGELTPVNTSSNHNLPPTPSTGCETPLHSKNRQTQSMSKNTESKRIPGAHKNNIDSISIHSSVNSGTVFNSCSSLSAQDMKEQINGARNDSVGISAGGTFNAMVSENSDDFLHARDCVNIPPPPYNAIGLNFPYRDSNDLSSSSSCGLPLPNYDFGKLSWMGCFEDRQGFKSNGEFENKTRVSGVDSTSGMDDYGNGTGVEQMSYLMHLQLLSLSDATSAERHNVNSQQTPAEWSGLDCASSFGINGSCCGRQTIGNDINGSDYCCVGPDTHILGGKGSNTGIRGAENGGDGSERNVESCLAASQFYYPRSINIHDYNGFISACDNKVSVSTTEADCNVDSTVSGTEPIRMNPPIEPGNYGLVSGDGEGNSSPWSMFHPALLNTSNNGVIDNSSGFFWNEGKWRNITTNNY